MLSKQKLEVEKEKEKDIENFVKEQDQIKKKGMQDIKDKYNQLCQKINLDANVLIKALQKKKQKDQEALAKQKASSSDKKKEEENVAPVQVEDMSDKPFGDNASSPKQEADSPVDFNSFAK